MAFLSSPGHIGIIERTIPYLKFRSYAGILMTIGHVAFAINFVWIIVRSAQSTKTGPTLFRTPPEMEVTAQ